MEATALDVMERVASKPRDGGTVKVLARMLICRADERGAIEIDSADFRQLLDDLIEGDLKKALFRLDGCTAEDPIPPRCPDCGAII